MSVHIFQLRHHGQYFRLICSAPLHHQHPTPPFHFWKLTSQWATIFFPFSVLQNSFYPGALHSACTVMKGQRRERPWDHFLQTLHLTDEGICTGRAAKGLESQGSCLMVQLAPGPMSPTSQVTPPPFLLFLFLLFLPLLPSQER